MKTIIVAASMSVVVLGLSSCSHIATPGHPREVTQALPNEPLPPVQFEWPQDKAVGVSLSFDDARASQLDAGVPLLNTYGVKATFYVSIPPAQQRRADWKAVLAAGHEIGNH